MRLFFAASLFAISVGCELSEPCDRYAEYMCDCHLTANECDQLRASVLGSETEVQDQCSIDLSNQQVQDDEDGVVCDVPLL